MYPILKLKPGKENNVVYRHPWVFSGAIASSTGDLSNGDFVRVADADGRIIGTGSFSSYSQIAVRIFEFAEAELNREWVIRRLSESHQRRIELGFGPQSDTTGYRVVFGEADRVPGLIVDRYNNVFVLQSSTAGADRVKALAIEALVQLFSPRSVVERSDIPVRKDECIEEVDELCYGADVEHVEFQEYGIKYLADVLAGQKTGFFLDQKDLRRLIRAHAKGRSVLNLFSNTGSFSIAALLGGASSVLNIDSSGSALDMCAPQLELNNIPTDKVSEECGDVFEWLTDVRDEKYSMVILDPPALIKSQGDLESGKKAYHFLNRAAMRLLQPGGLLVSSSCSSYFRDEDFLFMLRRASVQAGKHIEILHYISQSPDHPWSVYFPESRYLKSFVCHVSN